MLVRVAPKRMVMKKWYMAESSSYLGCRIYILKQTTVYPTFYSGFEHRPKRQDLSDQMTKLNINHSAR